MEVVLGWSINKSDYDSDNEGDNESFNEYRCYILI